VVAGPARFRDRPYLSRSFGIRRCVTQAFSDLRSQIAEANGDELEQENARHQKALDDLKAEATTADGFNAQQYAKLKKLEDDLHALKLKNIKDQQQALNNASAGGSQPSSPDAPAPKPSSPQPTKAAPGISFVANNPTFLSGTPKEADNFIRMLKKGLDELAMRS
jgi:hypothetical protein